MQANVSIQGREKRSGEKCVCVAESPLSTDCKIIVGSLETSDERETKAKDKKEGREKRSE